jgi:hypothetical protein
VVPVGISLLNALDRKLMDREIRTALRNALNPAVLRGQAGPQGPPDPVRQAIRAASRQASGRLDFATLLPGVAGPLQALRGRPDLCAEWQSVAVETNNPPAGDPDDGRPAYVFISTDTDEGLRAGTFLAAGFSGDTNVYYVDNPQAEFRSRAIEPGQAYLCRVPGLDLAKAAGINDGTWRAIGDIGHTIAETARLAPDGRWRVVLHLSGGYKAMIPYLLVMAEGINSVCKNPDRTTKGREPTLRAFMLHESDDSYRVDVPVRALEGKLFADLLTVKQADEDGTLPAERSSGLFGLCVDHTGRLTTLGTIMVRVP